MAIQGKIQRPYMDTTHPELRPGEVYVGNVTRDAFAHRPWNTKRLGKRPYDVRGNPIPVATLFPMFVQKDELEKAGLTTIRAA